MKLYTRTGDDGTTGLFGGGRVSKDDVRVDAYGHLDEANAAIGLAHASIPRSDNPTYQSMRADLQAIQSDLLTIGAELATPAEALSGPAGVHIPRLSPRRVADLELLIDTYDALLPQLRTFILPGGTLVAASLHVARTVARRAERRIVTLASLESLNPAIEPYVNRLSDLLFVLARVANVVDGQEDIPWIATDRTLTE